MSTLVYRFEEIAPRPLRPEVYELDGISRASVEAHYKLYEGYVAKRNEILRKLADADLAVANQVFSEFRALKVDLTFAIGGIKNHELYFGHLGGGGGAPEGAFGELVDRHFGAVDTWRADLKATGMAGRGWAWTAYDWDEGRLFNYVGDAQNTFPVWNATPLVALDVYEHAYFLDYQTDRASYIDAFFTNLDWDVVNGWIEQYGIPVYGRGARRAHRRVRRRRLPVRLADVGLLARPDLPRRGHPHEGERQRRRDERLARLRPSARAAGGLPRRGQGLRAGVRGDRRRRARRGVLAGAAAMLGHARPIFLRFQRGGKMVATAGGAFLGVAPLVGAAGAGVWILVFALTRYASVASITAAASLPLWAWLFGYPWPVIAFGGAAGLGVVFLHRANIGRLARGGEPLDLRRRRSDATRAASP